VFSAPALLFFAITGGLQTFSLHEAARGSDYKPPAWLASAAQLHKKQTTVMPVRRARPADVPAVANSAPHAAQPVAAADAAMDGRNASTVSAVRADRAVDNVTRPKKNLLPMKFFFALIALSLVLSTLTGLYMAWRFSRRPGLFGTVFAAGIVVPLLLMLF
jgi:hypothetical protein